MPHYLICAPIHKGATPPDGYIKYGCQGCERDVTIQMEVAMLQDRPILFCSICVEELKCLGEGDVLDLYLKKMTRKLLRVPVVFG